MSLNDAARRAATTRLIEAHRAEYATILDEERAARGLVPGRGRGRPAVERIPAPPILQAIRSNRVTPALGITNTAWYRWMSHGVPVDRVADVAKATGLSVEVLWPEVAA